MGDSPPNLPHPCTAADFFSSRSRRRAPRGAGAVIPSGGKPPRPPTAPGRRAADSRRVGRAPTLINPSDDQQAVTIAGVVPHRAASGDRLPRRLRRLAYEATTRRGRDVGQYRQTAAMSYDLAVWEGEQPGDDAAAGEVYEQLYAAYIEGEEQPPTPCISINDHLPEVAE
ncbi:hypothetical protein AB0F90_01535 [Micromonospora chalcea]|uniref:hypothetical protein n=1 Tax=Micromonospora chalcea TaxID=1874 RepID=UPI0033FD7A7B